MRYRDRAALALGRQLARPSGVAGELVAGAMRLANRRPTRALLDALDLERDHSLLDVGCGDGSLLAAAGDLAWRFGIDASPTMVASARRRLARPIAVRRADIVEGDMMRLPLGPRSVDRIAASNILYFCDDVAAFLAECRRIARPGARLGVYVTDAASMARWRFAGPATHRHFDEAVLAAALGEGVRIGKLPLPGGITGLVATVNL